MRGERPKLVCLRRKIPGSSPHARGTQTRCSWPPPATRIIPACAGNAGASDCARRASSDHPRMRGERRLGAFVLNVDRGSSPHARGTRQPLDGGGRRQRIIPACAGNAPRWQRSRSSRADHPRMRGERSVSRRYHASSPGSSPHARGTPVGVDDDAGAKRIIPACAGNAIQSPALAIMRPDHPRMRGERGCGSGSGRLYRGSSPHARGTPRAPLGPRLGRRIIPACAGNA